MNNLTVNLNTFVIIITKDPASHYMQVLTMYLFDMKLYCYEYTCNIGPLAGYIMFGGRVSPKFESNIKECKNWFYLMMFKCACNVQKLELAHKHAFSSLVVCNMWNRYCYVSVIEKTCKVVVIWWKLNTCSRMAECCSKYMYSCFSNIQLHVHKLEKYFTRKSTTFHITTCIESAIFDIVHFS